MFFFSSSKRNDIKKYNMFVRFIFVRIDVFCSNKSFCKKNSTAFFNAWKITYFIAKPNLISFRIIRNVKRLCRLSNFFTHRCRTGNARNRKCAASPITFAFRKIYCFTVADNSIPFLHLLSRSFFLSASICIAGVSRKCFERCSLRPRVVTPSTYTTCTRCRNAPRQL